MTNEQQKAKELAELLTAFADGKQLQYQDECDGTWEDCILSASLNGIMENFAAGFYFRIKPETKRIALTMQDLIDRINSHKPMYVKHGKAHRAIQDFDDESVLFFDDDFTYENFMGLVWYDGKPCYKEMESE